MFQLISLNAILEHYVSTPSPMFNIDKITFNSFSLSFSLQVALGNVMAI
jgi:hypothetical protein